MSLKDEYNRWKKTQRDEEQETAPSLRDEYRAWAYQKHGADEGKEFGKRMDRWLTNSQNYASRYDRDMGHYNPNTYGKDSDSLKASTARRQKERFDAEGKNLRLMANQYRHIFGEDWYNNIMKSLNQGSRMNDGVLKGYEGKSKYWDQFENKEAFEENLRLRQEYAKQEEERKKLLSVDLESGSKELEDLKQYRAELKEAESAPLHHNHRIDRDREILEDAENQIAEAERIYGSLDNLDTMISNKEQRLKLAKKEQDLEKLSNVTDPEFSKLSAMRPTPPSIRDWQNDPTGKFDTTDRLGIFLNETKSGMADAIVTAPNMSADFVSIITEGRDKNWDQLKQDEVNTYYYHLNKSGAEVAAQYLDALQDDLNRRKAGENFQSLEGNPLKEIAYGIRSGTAQFGTGIRNLFKSGSDYIAPSDVAYTAGAVREDLGDSSLLQGVFDLTTTTANMAPSILLSTVVGVLNPVAGEVVGATTMGLSAKGNAYQESINRGFTEAQAQTYSTMVGLSESTLQYFLGGIGKLGGKLSSKVAGKTLQKAAKAADSAIFRFAAKYGSTMFSEGLEEGLQEILDPWMQNLIFKTDEDVNWDEVAYSSLLGAVSAFLLDGAGDVAGNAFNKYVQQPDIGNAIAQEEGGIENLKELASQVATTGSNYDKKRVEKTIGKIADESPKSMRAVGELYQQTEKIASRADRGDLYRAVTSTVSDTNRGETGTSYEVSDNGQTLFQDEEVKIKDVAGSSIGKLTFNLEDGRTADFADISFGNESDAIVYNAIKNLDVDAENANKLLQSFREGDVKAEMFAKGIEDAFRMGKYNIPKQEMLAKNSVTQYLSEYQRSKAYELGQANATQSMNSATARLKQRILNGTVSKGGKVLFRDSINENTLTKRQDASVKALKAISEATGVNFILFQSPVNEKGQHIGKNGSYDPNTNTIEIDINAGQSGKDTILFTASHELTHFMKAWNIEKFKNLADFLVEKYGEKGVSVEELVYKQIKKAEANKRTISYDTAFEEMVADSMESMLADGNVLKTLEELRAKDRTTWEKIRDYITDLANRIRKVYRGLDPDSTEGKYVKEMSDSLEQFRKLFAEGLVGASENLEKASEIIDELPTETKFQMRSPVEKTEDLIAVHNITEAKLRKSLKLGGLPMPSIAIVKAADGHDKFGDYSIVFSKDSIDPELTRSNKIYSGDAWTPTYPAVQYKVNEKLLTKIRKKISDLVPYEVRTALRGAYLDPDNVGKMLDDRGGDYVEYYLNDDAVKYAYLLDTGKKIDLPVTEKNLTNGTVSNGAIKYFADILHTGPVEELKKWRDTHSRDLMRNEDLKKSIAYAMNQDILSEFGKDSPHYIKYEQNPLYTAENLSLSEMLGMLEGAIEYKNNGIHQTVDYSGARSAIGKAVDKKGYTEWLHNLFDGIIEKEGIRNNKDWYTPSGNRRSFEALHYEHNLDNVIKAMKESGEKGIGMFGGSIFGGATTEFQSLEDVKAAEGRLQRMSEDEIIDAKKEISQRFRDLSYKIVTNKNSFSSSDSAQTMMAEAIMKYKTKSGILNYLRREGEGWTDISAEDVDELIDIVREIRSMPTAYFESKPRRAVGFDEVYTVIAPDTMPSDLENQINDLGISVEKYASDDSKSRLEVTNTAAEDVKFSDRDSEGNALTKEQIEFFKGSKVRNKDGRLKVVHHGTYEHFFVFDIRKTSAINDLGRGHYFTDQKTDAEDNYNSPNGPDIDGKIEGLAWDNFFDMGYTEDDYYSNEHDDDWNEAYDKAVAHFQNGRTISAYLDIKNPVYSDQYGRIFTADGVEVKPRKDAEKRFDGYSGEIDYKYLLSQGYDGIIDRYAFDKFYKDSPQYKGVTHYIVFNSNQIKSVDNKKPTSDPDIRYSDRDASGRKLSSAQAKYFAGSKMRDFSGLLKPMMHGSPEFGFTKFDPAKSEDGLSLWFTDSLDTARSYAGNTVMKSAVKKNLTNPKKASMDELAQILAGDFYHSGYKAVDLQTAIDMLQSKGRDAEIPDVKKGSHDGKVIMSPSGSYIMPYKKAVEVATNEVNSSAGIYPVYLNLKHPLIIDAKRGIWSEIPVPKELKTGSLAYEDTATTRQIAAAAKGMGYDGVIFRNIFDKGQYRGEKEFATIATAFYPNQVKDIYNRHPSQRDDIRYSERLDSDYMEAVKSDDMGEAQRMVDEAAKNAGFEYQAFHGSPKFGFTVFNPAKSDDRRSLFFTNSKKVASTYNFSGEDKRQTIGKPLNLKENYSKEEANTIVSEYKGYWNRKYQTVKSANIFTPYLTSDSIPGNEKTVSVDKGYGFSDGMTLNQMKQEIFEAKRGTQSGIYGVYLKMENPFVADAKGRRWDEISVETKQTKRYEQISKEIDELNARLEKIEDRDSTEYDQLTDRVYDLYSEQIDLEDDPSVRGEMTTRQIAAYADKNGFDGVIIKNVHDSGGKSLRFDSENSDVYIVFNGKQVKSADPVTYDDSGNVIPLSKRFDQGEKDVRFSDREEAEVSDQVEKYSLRTKPDPKVTRKVYKLMRLGDDRNLYPLFIDSAAPVIVGNWYDADSPSFEELRDLNEGYYLMDGKGDVVEKSTKKPGKPSVEQAALDGNRWMRIQNADSKQTMRRYAGVPKKFYNVGINGSGSVSEFALRPGWHAGSLPVMDQIGLEKNRNIRDDSFVWVEGEIPYDIDYQEEAESNPDNDIPFHIPTDGSYIKGTSSFVTKGVVWYISGAFKPVRIISDREARRVVDNFNDTQKDADAPTLHYDFPRDQGRVFNAETMQLEEGNEQEKYRWRGAKESTELKKLAYGDDIRFSDRDPSLEKVNDSLQKENAKLKDDVSYLKELLKLQKSVTGGKFFTKSSVESMAAHLRSVYDSKADKAELTNALNSVYEYIASGEELSWDGIVEQSQEAVDLLADNLAVRRDPFADDILKQMHSSKIRLDESQKAEAKSAFGSVNDFRKSVMGNVIISDSANTSLDSWWQEMSSEYPSIFSPDVVSGDMPSSLFDAIDTLRSMNQTDFIDKEALRGDILQSIYDGYWRVSTLKTVADVKQKEIMRLKGKHTQQMERFKAERAEAIQKIKLENAKELAKVRKDMRKDRDEKISKLKADYQASRKTALQRQKENRDKREARAKLQKLVLDTENWISYPKKDKPRVPDFLKKPYADFLVSINLDSRRLYEGGEPTKSDLRIAASMDTLATTLERVAEGQNPENESGSTDGFLDLPKGFMENIRDMAEAFKERATPGNFNVNEMTSSEVKELTKTVKTLNHAIREIDTVYNNALYHSAVEMGAEETAFNNSLGVLEKENKVSGFLTWDNALPYYAFKRFGKVGESIFNELIEGQGKLARLSEVIMDFSKKNINQDLVEKWSKDVHTIGLPNGETIRLTTADAMSIYCLWRREAGLQHMLGGGIRIIGKDKRGKSVSDSEATLGLKDVLAIVDSLDKDAVKVADSIQHFMSTVCSEWGNEISIRRFMTRDFGEAFYYPIEVNDENLKQADPSAQQADLFRLLNMGFTKPLQKGANNQVIIRNIFDVFANHASDMARLNAFGMPILDMMKWLNYKTKTELDDGSFKTDGVAKSMRKAYGSQAKKYVINLIKDINGRAGDNGDPTALSNIFNRLMSGAKVAAAGGSIKVGVLQVTSYPRAAMVLSPRSMALALTRKPQYDKAKKYCGIALWKSYGYYDVNISRTLEEKIKGTRNMKDKIVEWSLKLPELGDALTIGVLWNACEYDVAKTSSYPVGSEEFNRQVGEKLSEVIYSTQVVDSVLTRSQVMRSKNVAVKDISAFMSEPTVSTNILMNAYNQWDIIRRQTDAKTAWSKAGKGISKAVGVYLMMAAVESTFDALWKAYRDEDDDKFKDKFTPAFWESLLEETNPLSKVPLASDFVSMVSSFFGMGYFNTESIYLSPLGKMKRAVSAVEKAISGAGTAYNAIYQTTNALSSISGIPVGNVMRDAVDLWNNTAGRADPSMKVLRYDRETKEKSKLLLDFLIAGKNTERIENDFENHKAMINALRAEVKRRVMGGGMSAPDAVKALTDHAEMEQNDAFWKVDEWKTDSEDYTKYAGLFTAVENGNNLKKVIADYESKGVSKDAMASQITKHFKPIYIEKSKAERSRLRGYLRNGFLLTGSSDESVGKKLARWDMIADLPNGLYTDYQALTDGMSKKEDKVEVIDSMRISKKEKDALYLAEGWAESGLDETPWH